MANQDLVSVIHSQDQRPGLRLWDSGVAATSIAGTYGVFAVGTSVALATAQVIGWAVVGAAAVSILLVFLAALVVHELRRGYLAMDALQDLRNSRTVFSDLLTDARNERDQAKRQLDDANNKIRALELHNHEIVSLAINLKNVREAWPENEQP